jgi:hypothetical protein
MKNRMHNSNISCGITISNNHKDEYPQMTTWLERKEKIHRHALFVNWCLAGCPLLQLDHTISSIQPHFKMTRHPSVVAVSFATLLSKYRAQYFRSQYHFSVIVHYYTDVYLYFQGESCSFRCKAELSQPHTKPTSQYCTQCDSSISTHSSIP